MLAIQTNCSTPAAALGRRAHSHSEVVKRSRSQLFLSIRLVRATALTETIRWMPINIRMESGGLHAYIEGIMTINLR